MREMLVGQTTQIAVGLGILLAWWIYYRVLLGPWIKSDKRKDFPFVGLLVAIGMTLAGLLFVTTELAFRSPLLNERKLEQSEYVQEREVISAAESSKEQSIAEKEARMIEENRTSNEEAKKAFSELPKFSPETSNK